MEVNSFSALQAMERRTEKLGRTEDVLGLKRQAAEERAARGGKKKRRKCKGMRIIAGVRRAWLLCGALVCCPGGHPWDVWPF